MKINGVDSHFVYTQPGKCQERSYVWVQNCRCKGPNKVGLITDLSSSDQLSRHVCQTAIGQLCANKNELIKLNFAYRFYISSVFVDKVHQL